jgi:tRNA threonylcarbamoyladenosine biosynthesis protein TsaE
VNLVSTYTFYTNNPEQTEDFAKRLAKMLAPKDVLLLEGDLGAGKTTFTKGLAKGLGITKVVKSPTFTIIKEYQGKLPLFHMDVYRLEDSDEDLGFDEYFEGDGVTVVEWASMIQDFLPKEYLEIHINHEGELNRRIHLIPKGEHYNKLCEELMK